MCGIIRSFLGGIFGRKLGLFFLLTLITLMPLISFAGAKDGAGDFGHAAMNLQIISFELAQQLRSRNQIDLNKLLQEPPTLAQPMLDKNMVQISTVAQIIGSIRPDFSENVEERFLFWGSDAQGVHIKALKNFYIVFGDLPLNQWSESRIMEVRARLLKEASHTWGYNDRQGSGFAQALLKEIYPNIPENLSMDGELTLDQAKKVRLARLNAERDELLRKLQAYQAQLAKVDARLTSAQETLAAKKSGIEVGTLGRTVGTPLVRNHCLDAAIKSWLFLGIGGLICAIDTASSYSAVTSRMDADFTQATENLRTEKVELEKNIANILNRLNEIQKLTT